MSAALTLLLSVGLLPGALCQQFEAFMPSRLKVLNGSCVTIPCSFQIPNEHNQNLDDTCAAIWMYGRKVVFISNDPQNSDTKGNFTGNLLKKDCTTTLYNLQSQYSGVLNFRLQCDNNLKYTFPTQKLEISVEDDPHAPALTPPTLKVGEGTSVSLACSAPATCLSPPPSLTWTPGLGEAQEMLQKNQDKTRVKISVLNFTASHLHDGQEISCTAVYSKQDGSTESSVTSRLTAEITYSPKNTTVSVSPSGPVQEDSNVTLTCSSRANPAVKNYTWYRADEGQETLVGTGPVYHFKASKHTGPFFCQAENEEGAGRSNSTQMDVQFPPQIQSSSVCTRTGNQVNCSCEATGNPAPSFQWAVDGLSVNHSDKSVINNGVYVSFITMSQTQWKDQSTLICSSSNSLGSTSQRFIFYSLEDETSPVLAPGHVILIAFIATIVVLLVLVCALLVLVCTLLRVIRAQKIPHNPLQASDNPSTVAEDQLLPGGEGNEDPTKAEEAIYANSNILKKPQANNPSNTSATDSTNVPSSGQNSKGDGGKSSEEKNKSSEELVYTTVTWRSKGQKETKDTNLSSSSTQQDVKCTEGGSCRDSVEMGNLYDNIELGSIRKESECEYAQVKFKDKGDLQR